MIAKDKKKVSLAYLVLQMMDGGFQKTNWISVLVQF